MCDLGCIASCNGVNPYCAFPVDTTLLLEAITCYCMYIRKCTLEEGFRPTTGNLPHDPALYESKEKPVPPDLPQSYFAGTSFRILVSITHGIYPRGKKKSDDIREACGDDE